ncbi:hypothetical protein ACN6LA_004880, partial [Streptomyces sp. SAS_269]
MPTLTLPRTFSRAGATVLLTALAAAGASWVVAPGAAAQGENGDIRIHNARSTNPPSFIGSVMVDADGSADGGEIVSYVSALVSGADFAKGSRF